MTLPKFTNKTNELQKIRETMEQDKDLPYAKIVFVGEAGGYHESVQRKPFVGNAGMLLNQLLHSIELERKGVYITNMVKTRPPENRDPLPKELEAFGKYLDKEIEIINPKIIVTLGRFSMAKFLPGVKISIVHGKVFDVNWKGREIKVVPMYHPAAALRNGDVMFQIKEDFLKLPGLLKEINSKIEAKQMELI